MSATRWLSCYGASDLLMAVEIISPSSRSHDKTHRRALHAEAGIDEPFQVDIALV